MAFRNGSCSILFLLAALALLAGTFARAAEPAAIHIPDPFEAPAEEPTSAPASRFDARPTGLFDMKPITQGNLYWRHIWKSEGITTFWAGMADQHHQFVLGQPPRPASNLPFVFGAEVYLPMNDYLALWGQANFITPNDTGTVTATLGFAFYPGGRAWTAGRNRFAPMLPVANNPTFAVDTRQ